jgi:hypothetical protein
VFFFYYVWGALLYLIYLFRYVIEYFYIRFNHPFVIFKRDFNDLSYFEKLFLSFFHRRNWFKNSIANIFTNHSMFNYRLKNYPLIFFFHLYFDKMEYKLENLKLLIKQHRYFLSSKTFKYTFNFVRRIFFLNSFFNKNTFKDKFIQFLIIERIFYKKYYNLCSSVYFINYSNLNTLKLNWIFYIFMLRSKGKKVIYDLSKYSDWYIYNFTDRNTTLKSTLKSKKKSPIWIKYHILKKFNFWNKYYKYNTIYRKLHKAVNLNYDGILSTRIKLFWVSKISFYQTWLSILKNLYVVRFSESSISKHINLQNLKCYVFLYLRKNKIFNKSRYSRNRQLYRTGVYWCLWLNVILVYGLYFLFYRFTFNFGYIWWGVLIFSYSTIFSRVVKYNFFNPYFLIEEFVCFVSWLGLLFINCKHVCTNLFEYFFFRVSLFSYLIKFSNFKYEYILNTPVLSLIVLYINQIKYKKSQKFIYFWENLKEVDNSVSVFRIKNILHWLTQILKLLLH